MLAWNRVCLGLCALFAAVAVSGNYMADKDQVQFGVIAWVFALAAAILGHLQWREAAGIDRTLTVIADGVLLIGGAALLFFSWGLTFEYSRM